MAAISRPTLKVTVGPRPQHDYATITAALKATENLLDCLVVIQIASGDYYECLKIYGRQIQLIGIGQVRIIGTLSAQQVNQAGESLGTFRTATCFINGCDIQLHNLAIINAAGQDQQVGQALAVYCEGDQISFQHCRLHSHQDTLCLGPLPQWQKDGTAFQTPAINFRPHRQRTYFIGCQISGTVDFIFGGGSAYFWRCQLQVLPRQNQQAAYVTAASTAVGETGLIFAHCQVSALGAQHYYLGRPWRSSARTIFQAASFDCHLLAAGWHDWQQPANQKTVYYAEIGCYYQNLPQQRPQWIHWHE